MSPQDENERQSTDVIEKPKTDHEENQNDGHGVKEHDGEHAQKQKMMPLFSRPKQRQRWGDNQVHPHTDWGDIFFDLFFVAA
jgi:hypothetical protein